MVIVLIATLVLTGASEPHLVGPWMAPSARCDALASRLRIAPALDPVVTELCRRAPTFRRQVVRLARHRGLDVTVAIGQFTPGGSTRARTSITRVEGQLRSAVVEVPFTDAALLAELVAHEFEHILEQLDGIELSTWVGHSGVRRLGSGEREGPFETERARQIGRAVATEYLSGGATMAAFRGR